MKNLNLKNILCGAASLAIVGGGMLLGSLRAEAQNDYWHQRVSLFAKLPVVEGDIVFLGNSITDGGEFQELFGREDVKNRGIVGDVINGVSKRLHQVTDGKPSKIFLLIGINDVSHGLTAEKIAERYESLVKEIRTQSPESALYVQSVLPINNDFNRYKNLKGREGVIPELNTLLEDVAARNGAVYVDLWPTFADESGKLRKDFTTDGLHLSGAGYKAWAAALSPLVSMSEAANPVIVPAEPSEGEKELPTVKRRVE